jgi:dipeptidase
MNKKTSYFVLLAFFLIQAGVSVSAPRECFLLMVGKDASKSGKMLLAHNNDLSGKEASMLVKIPAGKEMITLPDSAHTYGRAASMLVIQIYKGFSEGDAVAINEYGVAVAGGLSLKRDRNSLVKEIDPLVSDGVGGGIRYFALQHAKTARECIKIIGECYDKYGVAYPSGVGIADSNEMWYIEAGGGHSWAAVRVPNDCYIVAANNYCIGEIDFSDTLNFMYSKNLPEFYKKSALTNNLYSKFNFAGSFGGGGADDEGHNYYNSRRVWRAINLFSPNRNFPPDIDFFPLFLQPDNKISLENCFSVLRDYYENTPFYIFAEQNRENPARAIATFNGVHTEVIEITPGKPVSYGTVLWAGLSSPFSAVYVPFYFGINSVPTAFSKAARESDTNSAFWVFKSLGDMGRKNYPERMKQWRHLRDKFEAYEISEQNVVVRQSEQMIKSNPDAVTAYLEERSKHFSKKALILAKEMLKTLSENNK